MKGLFCFVNVIDWFLARQTLSRLVFINLTHFLSPESVIPLMSLISVIFFLFFLVQPMV